MYSLSALYMLRSVPIVKVILVIFFKKKKKKNDPYFGMGKNTKSYATKNPAIYLFLGKGRESFISNFIKTKLSALSALPTSTQTFSIQTQCGRCTPKFMPKLTKNSFFLQISHLSSNRRVHNLTLYFQFTTPARELTHRMKFEYPEMARILETPCFFTTLSQRNIKNPTQKQHEFQQRHNSLLP